LTLDGLGIDENRPVIRRGVSCQFEHFHRQSNPKTNVKEKKKQKEKKAGKKKKERIWVEWGGQIEDEMS